MKVFDITIGILCLLMGLMLTILLVSENKQTRKSKDYWFVTSVVAIMIIVTVLAGVLLVFF